jgi:hypothetical protein
LILAADLSSRKAINDRATECHLKTPTREAFACPEFAPPEAGITVTRDRPACSVTGRLFTFLPSCLRALRDDLKRRVTTLPGATATQRAVAQRISTFDATTALVWVSVMRARHPIPSSKPFDSKIAFTINVRQRLGVDLPTDYVGNAALYTIATLPSTTLLATTGSVDGPSLEAIAAAALAIRMANIKFDERAIMARLAYMTYLQNPGSLQPVVDPEGSQDLVLTSWLDFGGNADFGTIRLNGNKGKSRDAKDEELNGDSAAREYYLGKPDHMRKPVSTYSSGGCIIMPRRTPVGETDEVPFEVFAQLRVDQMETLTKGLMLYAKNWVE